MCPTVVRGKSPEKVTGTGEDEEAAMTDLRIRLNERRRADKLTDIDRRGRPAYLERAEAQSQAEVGQPLLAVRRSSTSTRERRRQLSRGTRPASDSARARLRAFAPSPVRTNRRPGPDYASIMSLSVEVFDNPLDCDIAREQAPAKATIAVGLIVQEADQGPRLYFLTIDDGAVEITPSERVRITDTRWQHARFS